MGPNIDDNYIFQRFDNAPYVNRYVALSLSAVFVTMLSGFTLQFTGIRGAKNLHSHMLNKILRVPMRFFDTNPSGRILNRFSSDIGQIDQVRHEPHHEKTGSLPM